MKIITIDSNVPNVPSEISELLNYSTSITAVQQWCSDECRCKDLLLLKRTNNNNNDANKITILYDTPIAMCTDIKDIETAETRDVYSFVYIDYNRRNESYHRMLKNVPNLSQVCIISKPPTTVDDTKADDYNNILGTQNYILKDCHNCSSDIIVKFMVILIDAFTRYNKMLHPHDLLMHYKKQPIHDFRRVTCVEPCNLYDFSNSSSNNCLMKESETLVRDCDIICGK